MAKTPSKMVSLGSTAKDFHLFDVVSKQTIKFSDYTASAEGVLLMFICNHCPFVKHVMDELVRIGKDYQNKNIKVMAINSNNNPDYPEDSFDNMSITAQEYHFSFPYLFDETQEVAKAYEATCTPDFFIYDRNKHLIYRGQLDDSRPGNGKPVTGLDIRHALDCLLKNMENTQIQKPSIGCNIKWTD